MSIQKVSWNNSDDRVYLSLPFAKVDKEKRTVSGFATLDNLDKHGDIVTADASQIAFDKFRGNLREMHQPIAVGKVVSFTTQDFFDKAAGRNYKGVFVNAYISKGAEDTWQKVLDGTLTGFSIGGDIVQSSMEPDEENVDENRRVIKEYNLMELSLVDNPANPLANIFSIQKVGGNPIFKGMATEIELENIFWCGTDEIASSHSGEEKSCVICNDSMENIGWVEKNDFEKYESIEKVVDNYLKKDDAPGPSHGPDNIAGESPASPINTDQTLNLYPDQNSIGVTKGGISVGSFVTWSSSGGKAYGKVKKIVKSGTVSVPGSSFKLNASEDDPVALITIYKKTDKGFAPTDTVVGHKLDTLKIAKKKSSKINKINKEGGTEMENTPDELETVEEFDTTDEVTETTEELEKAVVSEVQEDDLDFTKMITDLKNFFGAALEKSAEAQKEINNKVEGKIEKSSDKLKSKIEDLKVDYSSLLEKNTALEAEIKDLKKSLADTAVALDSYVSDTAVKKSGEVEQAAEMKLQKSIWQGHFLGVSDL